MLVNRGGMLRDETSRRFPVTTDTSRGGGLADLDGDGDRDLIVATASTSPSPSTATAAAASWRRRSAPPQGWTRRSPGLELVDLDRDGDLDVYLPNAGAFIAGHGFGGGQDRYLENDGHAGFTDRTDRHFPAVADPTTDAAFGDIDGDHDLDLVVGNTGENGTERVFVRDERGHHG